MTKGRHPHPHTDELHVFLIPAEPEEQMELVVLPNNAAALSRRLSATHLYIIHEDLGLPALDCGCPLFMALNYEGQVEGHELAPNMRASLFLQNGDIIYGDVLMVGEGVVKYDDGRTDVDFVSLTPSFHDWQGPGHPVPSSSLPWHN